MKDKIIVKERLYHISVALMNWSDQFNRKEYQNFLNESLSNYQAKTGIKLYAYSMLGNYLHFITTTYGGQDIQDIMDDIKIKINNKNEFPIEEKDLIFKWVLIKRTPNKY